MRRLSLCASLLAVAVSARSATAGLDLTWNACNTSASGADNVVLSCDGSSGASLFGNFQSPQAIPQFLAMDVVIDLRTGGGTLAPFWHFESGGCNEGGLGLSDSKPTAQCPNATNGNLWGPNGNEATAAITSYDPGHDGTDRLRVLITIARAASSPVALTAGQNYFGFELDLATDNAATCSGCTTPAVIGWSKAVLYGSSQTIEVYQSGTRLASVAVNGGIPGPTVFTVRPESAPSTAPASADLFGRNLVSGTTAKLTRSGQSDISGTGTTTSTLGDLLHTAFDITGKPDGFWNVNVANGGNNDAIVNAFRTTGAFLVDSMFPRIGSNGMTVPVTIYGSQILAPATVRLKRLNQPDVVGAGTTVAGDGHSLQTTFALQMIDLGPWDVEVTNGDGAKKNVPGGFEIVTPLQITSVSPNSSTNGGTAQLTVGGMGFRPGISVALVRVGQANIFGNVLSVDPGGTSLVAQFNLVGAAPGLWDLRAANPGGLPVTAGNVFLISIQPTVASIEPHVGGNTGSVAVVITGANFSPSAVPRLTRAGQPTFGGIGTVVDAGGDSIATTFDLVGAAQGLWNVEVVNPGNIIGALPSAFEVRAGPVLTSVTPNVAPDTAVVSITISGSNILAGATSRLSRAGETDIVGASVVVAPGGTSISATFDIRGRAAGLWNVTVSNPNQTAMSIPNGFTISKVPLVTNITPTLGSDRQTAAAVVIGGSRFQSGLTVRLERSGSPSIDGNITALATDGTSVNATFNLFDRAVGFYDVVVINPANLVGRLAAGFEIRGAPRITSVSPSTSTDANPVTLAVSGSNIHPGATTKLTLIGDADIVGTSVVVDPQGMSLSAVYDVRGRTQGLWNVVVTNSDGFSGTLPNGFLLTGTLVTSVSPDFGSDTAFVDVTINGGPFLPGAIAWLERLSAQVVNAYQGTVAPGGQAINASFALHNVAPGFYDVVVMNPGFTPGRLTGGFEVRSAPHVIGFSPGFGFDTAQVVCTITGRRIDLGATTQLVGASLPTIVGTGTVVGSGGDIVTTTFDLHGQPVGARTLRVVQQDASVLTAKVPFWVQSHTKVDVPAATPSELALASVAPNPTRGFATVTFTLPSESRARVSVVDLQGREWAELTNGTWPAGRHEVRWNARGGQVAAPTGMYFMRMEAAGRTFVKRFVLAR